MRARFADRIRELYRTYTESAAALERAAEQAEAGRVARLPTVRAELAAIEALRARAADLERAATADGRASSATVRDALDRFGAGV